MKPRSALLIIATGIAVLLGMVAWLIMILSDSSRWCGIAAGVGNITGQKLPISDCTGILMALIPWLGWIAMGLLATAALAFTVIVITDRNADIDLHGPGGIGLKAGRDDIKDGDQVEIRKAD